MSNYDFIDLNVDGGKELPSYLLRLMAGLESKMTFVGFSSTKGTNLSGSNGSNYPGRLWVSEKNGYDLSFHSNTIKIKFNVELGTEFTAESFQILSGESIETSKVIDSFDIVSLSKLSNSKLEVSVTMSLK